MLRRCVICLYPDTKPDLHFNADGVCSACVNHKRKAEIDWLARAKEFERLISSLPKNGSGYDVIVPSSGGKDSHAQVVKMIEFGLKPLIVTATTCHLTEIGRKNIDNLKKLATTIEVSPDAVARATLNRLSMQHMGDISWPEHASIFTLPFRMAVALGIPAIIYGESPQFEYGGPPGAEDAREMTSRWVSEYGGFLGWRARDFVGTAGLTLAQMRDYELPSKESLRGVVALFLGQYYPWDSRANAKVAVEHGMSVVKPHEHAWWEFENLDNAQTVIHDHQMWRKYGYGRATAQISVDIRNGLVSRDDALKFIQEREGWLPWINNGVDLDQIRKHIGMTLAEFYDALDRFTNWEIMTRDVNDQPVLKDFANRRVRTMKL